MGKGIEGQPNKESKEALSERYETELQKSSDLHKKFNADEDRQEPLDDEIGRTLRERVQLIGELEDIKTMQEVFPDEAYPEGYLEDMKERRKEESAGGPPRPNEQDAKAFELYTDALKERAQELGYKIVNESPENNYIDLEKGDLIFSMKYPTVRYDDEYMGGSKRITKLEVVRVDGKGKHLDFQHSWGMACEDPDIQREIDRFIAAFG